MILLQAFLRGGLVFVVAGLLTLALSRRSAALRHHIWASATIIQLALLWLMPALPEIPLGIPVPAVSSVFHVPAPSTPAATTTTSAETPAPAAPQLSAVPTRSPRQIDWARTALYVWLIGAALVFLRYLIGTLFMARTARYGRRVDDGAWLSLAQRIARELAITRPVTLLWGDKLVVPVTWGIFYPMVLLPESAQDWPEERRRFVLVHEFAHIKRFDALTQLVAQLTLAVFWFSPFVWLAEWRLRVEREHACDDVVLHHGTDASLYADQLLQMVRTLITKGSAQPAFAALAMARRSEFEGRMLAILDPTRRRGAASITSSLLFVLLSLVIAAPVAAVQLYAPDGPAQIPQPARSNAVKHIAGVPCDTTAASTSIHVNANDDSPQSMFIEMTLSKPGSCLKADIRGQVVFNDDETAVRELGRGAYVRLREVTAGSDVEARIEQSGTGLNTTVTNGTLRGNDAAVQQWIARVLPVVLREAAINTAPRVARMLAAHGLRGTLETIAAIRSPSARTEHYLSLIEARRWSDDQLADISRAATQTLSSNGSDLRRVRAAFPNRVSAQNKINWVEQGLSSIESSGDLRSALTAQLGTADKPNLLMLMRVSKKITSSAEKSAFLTAAAPFALTRRDAELDTAWFDAVATVSSSYDRSNALTAAINFAHGNAPLRDRIAEAAANLGSSEKVNVLSALATVR